LNSGKTFDTKTKVAIAKLSNGVFSENDLVSLKSNSRACWEHLGDTVKGAYCAICDAREGAFRFSRNDKILIGYDDLRSNAKYCGKYQNIFMRFLSYTQDLYLILKVMDPTFAPKHSPTILTSIQTRVLVRQTARCRKDPKFCQSEVLLKEFHINFVTKLEEKNLHWLEDMAKGMIKYFHNPDWNDP